MSKDIKNATSMILKGVINEKTSQKVFVSANVEKYDILSVTGIHSDTSGGKFLKCAVATNANGLVYGPLLCAAHAAPSGTAIAAYQQYLIPGDFSGGSAGDPVYISTGGEPTLTAAGNIRRIGVVLVAAVDGLMLFAPAQSVPGRNLTIAGIAVVLSGQSSVTITGATLGGAYGGKPVVATLNELDGTATLDVLRATWSSNDLTITLSAATNGDRDVAYFISIV